MSRPSPASILTYFRDLPDPRRQTRNTKHPLIDILVLALPIPFDNLLPAWAILFFCLALIEDDGVMAMLGWLFTLLTALWTIFLLMIGRAAIMTAVATVRQALFD